jgi:hypothetical protein
VFEFCKEFSGALAAARTVRKVVPSIGYDREPRRNVDVASTGGVNPFMGIDKFGGSGKMESDRQRMERLRGILDVLEKGGKLFKVLDKKSDNTNWHENAGSGSQGSNDVTDEDIDFLVAKGLIKETGTTQIYDKDNVIYQKA